MTLSSEGKRQEGSAGEPISDEQNTSEELADRPAPRSSSCAAIPVYDAEVRRDRLAVGPVRLPEEQSPSFIQAFNRTYQAYGLTIEPRATGPQMTEPQQHEPLLRPEDSASIKAATAGQPKPVHSSALE